MFRPFRMLRLAIVLVVLGVVGVAAWWFILRDDAPPPADIDTASAGVDPADDGSDLGGLDDLASTWVIDPTVGSFDDFSGSWAGYRFDEQLADIGANTAVGRTPEVSGTMLVADGSVTQVELEVDLTTLESDNGIRDRALGSRGLEHDRYPTATFVLVDPIDLPDGVVTGDRLSRVADGELTVRGVTRSVTVDLDAELTAGRGLVVASAPIRLSDFDIEPPTGFSVVSVADQGTFEVQLFFAPEG